MEIWFLNTNNFCVSKYDEDDDDNDEEEDNKEDERAEDYEEKLRWTQINHTFRGTSKINGCISCNGYSGLFLIQGYFLFHIRTSYDWL